MIDLIYPQGVSSGEHREGGNVRGYPPCYRYYEENGFMAEHKHTPRSDELKRSLTRRLNRAIGQLGGVRTMIEEDRYCGDVLTQLAAAESAVRAVSREVLRDHMETCVVERVQAGDTEVVDEVCDLLRKFV